MTEMSQTLERVTRELEQARALAEKAGQVEQQASEAGVLRVALDDAEGRCERLAEQLRKTELEGLEVQTQLGGALNRCTAAEEKAVERSEQERRQRERADAAEKQVLALRGELDRSLSKVRQLESDVQAQNDALVDRQGAISAKVAELSEREIRLTAALEAEKDRVSLLTRELSGECCAVLWNQ
jgi:chromosome segregation ATPase